MAALEDSRIGRSQEVTEFRSVTDVLCERCGESIDVDRATWLELSSTDGRYYAEGKLPVGHVSQGCFPFGTSCGYAVLSNRGRNRKICRAR